jgi:two-component system NtrC family sensor kinase
VNNGGNDLKNTSLSSILESGLNSGGANSKHAIEEDKLKHALLERRSFSVKLRLILTFLILFLVSAGISVTATFMLSQINRGVEFVALTDKFANEIQHARRSEKNYFIYHSDLAEVLNHLEIANEYLDQASQQLGHLVGIEEMQEINLNLVAYKELVDTLIKNDSDPGFRDSEKFRETSTKLRDYGSKILAISLDISKKERQFISSTIQRAQEILIILIIFLLILSVFIASNIYKHIIARLNRLMEAIQEFASGKFSPITPRRKYRDEFSKLVIALNHMMYELDKRQNLLIESHKLRAVGNLTAGIAHELNNPINNIILTSEVLHDSYREMSREELEDAIHDLIIQGERAQQVVKNLLDFARESETKAEYLYVDKLLEETVKLAGNQIKISKVTLEKDFGKALPPIYGDRNLLIQVFLNLILNAIDAMPGGGKLSISVFEDKRTNFMSVKVSDTGIGIPEHILGSIFSPFFTTKQTGKGTGLGLAVSRGIIEKHGGNIEVESKEGAGSTFTIHLPIVPIPANLGDKQQQ